MVICPIVMRMQRESDTVNIERSTYKYVKHKAFLLNQVAPYLTPPESLEYWMVMYEGYSEEELANLFDIDLGEIRVTLQAARSKMWLEDLGQTLEALVNMNAYGYSFEFVADASDEDTIRFRLDIDENVEIKQSHLDTAWRETIRPKGPTHKDAPSLEICAPNRVEDNQNEL